MALSFNIEVIIIKLDYLEHFKKSPLFIRSLIVWPYSDRAYIYR